MNTSLCLWRCHDPYLVSSWEACCLCHVLGARSCALQSSSGKTSARGAGEISRHPPYPSTTESCFIDYPRRGVSVRESPALLISRKLARFSIARLSIPDQGSYLESWWATSTIIIIIYKPSLLAKPCLLAKPDCRRNRVLLVKRVYWY